MEGYWGTDENNQPVWREGMDAPDEVSRQNSDPNAPPSGSAGGHYNVSGGLARRGDEYIDVATGKAIKAPPEGIYGSAGTYTFPDPSGGSMKVEASNWADAVTKAKAKGWSEGMGTYGINTLPQQQWEGQFTAPPATSSYHNPTAGKPPTTDPYAGIQAGSGAATRPQTPQQYGVPPAGTGATPTARDGQTLATQSPTTREAYYAAYGSNAPQQWIADHNAALPAGFTAPPATPTGAPGSVPGTVAGAPATPGVPVTGAPPRPGTTGAPGTTTTGGGSVASGAASSTQVYTTKNGQKTRAQMESELRAAGWGYSGETEDVLTAYARTTGGAVQPLTTSPNGLVVTPAAPAAPAAPLGGGGDNWGEVLEAELERLRNEAARNAAIAAHEAWMRSNGDDRLAFEKAVQKTEEALKALELSGSLRGPRNAFQQQAVNYGLNSQGFTKAIDGLLGRLTLPSFQAPQAAPQAVSLKTLAEDIKKAGSNREAAQSALNALPPPNKLSPTAWLNLDPDTQQFILGAYETIGYSANDVLNTVKNLLPQFVSPSATGAVR